MSNPNESVLQSALARYFDFQANQCFPSVVMWTWEQDFVVVTKAGRVWEVEIKISQADWLADKSKAKWESQNFKKIARFYYCVPEPMLAKGVPEWVPAYAGIIRARWLEQEQRWLLKTIRPALNRSTFVLSPRWLLKLYRSTYFRFWRSLKHDPLSNVFTEAQEPID